MNSFVGSEICPEREDVSDHFPMDYFVSCEIRLERDDASDHFPMELCSCHQGYSKSEFL